MVESHLRPIKKIIINRSYKICTYNINQNITFQKTKLMTPVKGYAAQNAKTPLAPFNFTRREPNAHDVTIDILYSGVCHSDIHQVRDEWGGSIFPMVPGHEILGRVSKVGSEVKKFKVGD